MLSQETLRLMKSSLDKVDFWSCAPYKWDDTKSRITIVDTRKRHILWYLNIGVHFFHDLYLIVQCLRVNYFEEKASPKLQVYMQYVAIAYMVPVVLHFSILVRKEELASYVNQLMDFLESFKHYGNPGAFSKRGSDQYKNGCEKFQRILLTAGKIVCGLNLVLQFRRPARPVFLTAVFPNVEMWKPWEIFPFACIQSYIWWTFWTNMYFHAVPLYAYIFPMTFCLRQLKLRRNRMNDTKTRDFLRQNCQEFARVFRCLQILQKKANYTLAICLPGHKILFMLLAVRSIYGSITMTGGTALSLSVVAMMLIIHLAVLFKILAEFHESSTIVLQDWQSKRVPPAPSQKWFGKFLKSCRPIRMQIGSLYFVDKQMVLTLFSTIIINTIGLLLTHGHEHDD